MTRAYNASRRKQAAQETRDKIIRAALSLHWDGITEYGPLAEEACCSVATVRKHFPTKEDLFQSCTRTFSESLTFPDLDALGKLTDPEQRLQQGISELCRIHEAMFGYAWLSAHIRDQSEILDSEMQAYEGLATVIVTLIAPDHPNQPILRGLLDFLTYRALRLSGALSPEQARDALITTVRPLLAPSTPVDSTKPETETQSP